MPTNLQENLARHLGDSIEIAVVDIRGDKVRPGITAPPDVPVHRREVYDQVKREERAARRVDGAGRG